VGIVIGHSAGGLSQQIVGDLTQPSLLTAGNYGRATEDQQRMESSGLCIALMADGRIPA